jgi:ankyrin repeat protein
MLRTALDHGEAVDRVHRGYTALHWAIFYGRESVASYLLEHGADPNIPDRDGETPLMLCAAARAMDEAASERIARLLLHFGARRELQTKAKDIARSRGKVSMLRLLT